MDRRSIKRFLEIEKVAIKCRKCSRVLAVGISGITRLNAAQHNSSLILNGISGAHFIIILALSTVATVKASLISPSRTIWTTSTNGIFLTSRFSVSSGEARPL